MNPHPKDRVPGHVGQGGVESGLEIVAQPVHARRCLGVQIPHQHGPGRKAHEVVADQPSAVATGLHLQQHETLVLVHLREGRAFHRARIEHRGVQRASLEIPPQHLVTVDVSRQNRGKVRGQIRAPDDVRRSPEGVVGRSHTSPLHAVVHAQEAHIGLFTPPTRLLQHLREVLANAPPLAGEAGQGHACVPRLDHDRLGTTKNVQLRVHREAVVGDPGPLVVSRYHENRNTAVGDLEQRPERLKDQGWGYLGAVEDIASMDDQVHLSRPGRCQGPFVVRQKIVPPPPTLYPGVGRQVEAQVGIGQEEYADGWQRIGHGSRRSEDRGSCSKYDIRVSFGSSSRRAGRSRR